jgi:hypothetical protein
MFPFVASQAITLTQAKQKSVEGGQRSADADAPVQTVKKGRFRRVLDALVESRRRKADSEIKVHLRRIGVDGHQ